MEPFLVDLLGPGDGLFLDFLPGCLSGVPIFFLFTLGPTSLALVSRLFPSSFGGFSDGPSLSTCCPLRWSQSGSASWLDFFRSWIPFFSPRGLSLRWLGGGSFLAYPFGVRCSGSLPFLLGVDGYSLLVPGSRAVVRLSTSLPCRLARWRPPLPWLDFGGLRESKSSLETFVGGLPSDARSVPLLSFLLNPCLIGYGLPAVFLGGVSLPPSSLLNREGGAFALLGDGRRRELLLLSRGVKSASHRSGVVHPPSACLLVSLVGVPLLPSWLVLPLTSCRLCSLGGVPLPANCLVCSRFRASALECSNRQSSVDAMSKTTIARSLSVPDGVVMSSGLRS